MILTTIWLLSAIYSSWSLYHVVTSIEHRLLALLVGMGSRS
jgi:hypothetical protein